MSKKNQTILTICIDIIMLAVAVAASYLLLVGKLHGGWQYIAQIGIIVAIPTIFFSTFLTFGMAKYEKMRPEEMEEDSEEENAEESLESQKENASSEDDA